MSYVYNSERTFREDMIQGLSSAYARHLRRVPHTSGLVSVAAPEPGRVSTIVGGGSGHFPTFAGLVGPGLADAAVCGEIFSSPSAEQAYRTIRAVDGGAGVLMLFGNYAGDVMHFGLAADQAMSLDGIDARITLTTDDIASSPPERLDERRGIAGSFFVFRAAAAAAHRGDPLDEVERIAVRTNAVTRTIGVGFDGCTVPGRDEPLFTVPAGSMVIGLGIHGEPGILTVPRVGADELGAMLVERLLAERPQGAGRARILVNGLGRVKYEELFSLYVTLARELGAAGVELTEPEVGEFVTSLDMAGCSVSLTWTDDELEELLSTPASTPGYTRSSATGPAWDGHVRDLPEVSLRIEPEPAQIPDDELSPSGVAARRVLGAMAAKMRDLEAHLGDLDAVAADGDHGTTMTRGMDAARNAAGTAGPDASAVLRAAGMAFADAAGGAAGALWGSGLSTVGNELADADPQGPSGTELAVALAAARAAVVRLGQARPGDKTLIDALDPFVAAFRTELDEGRGVRESWIRAAEAAETAARATADMAPRRGRAARLAERSVGSEDPGAVSLAASLSAAAGALDGPDELDPGSRLQGPPA